MRLSSIDRWPSILCCAPAIVGVVVAVVGHAGNVMKITTTVSGWMCSRVCRVRTQIGAGLSARN